MFILHVGVGAGREPVGALRGAYCFWFSFDLSGGYTGDYCCVKAHPAGPDCVAQLVGASSP